MGTMGDTFEPLPAADVADDFSLLSRRLLGLIHSPCATPGAPVATCVLHGFDLEERPMISGLAELAGEVVTARATIPLRREMIGSSAVVLFERGNARLPIIVGILQERSHTGDTPQVRHPAVSVQADDERLVVTAEREIVLRCGDSSITLTRAGKVIIKGKYVLSRSTGYNKIKGAAIDIN